MNRTVRIKLPALLFMSIQAPFRALRNWWFRRAENHYLICAEVERARIVEAQHNVRYYQTRAALARSNRI